MNVTIETMPEMRVANVRHVGPYPRIGWAFERLAAIAEPAGLSGLPGAALLAVYHDDPATTPADRLRSDAGVVIPDGVPLPQGLAEQRLPAGRYARTVHVGPYTGLGDVWARLVGDWLPGSGQRLGAGARYEIYRNTPATAPPEALRTDLYLPLA